MNRCLPPVLIESPKVLPFYWSTPKAHPGPHDRSALVLGTVYFHRHWHCGLVSKYLQVPHPNFRKVKFAKVPWQAGLLLVFINLGKHTIIKHSIWRVSLKSLESTTSLRLSKINLQPLSPFSGYSPSSSLKIGSNDGGRKRQCIRRKKSFRTLLFQQAKGEFVIT